MENNVTKQNAINELENMYNDINSIMKNIPITDNSWNDAVSIAFQNKVNEINAKKKRLLEEIRDLENIIKKDINN